MRRNLQRMMVALAAMMICLGASAIDKVVKKSEMKEEVTSVADLANATFMLQSGTGEEAVVLYTPSGWDIKVAPMVTAIAKQDNGGFFKLEALGDHYLIPVFNINKERRTFWSGNQYVNAQPTGNVIFGLAGTNDQHGQDGENLAVWDIAYTEGQGFTFHCYGRDVYIGYDAEAARPSTTPVYWRAYKSYIAGYDVDEVTAAYEAVAAAVKTTAAATALSEAKTAYDSDNDLDKFGDAVNAAIDVVNACVAINATYTNLDTYGAAIATEVLAKYNAGEYANAEELRAAYIVAAKAQRTAGADFTGAIINPGFEYGNTDGWTTVASADTGARETSNGTYAATGSEGNYLFNTWWKGTPCTQTIAGLPNGTYKLSALVASDGATIYLTANGGHNEGTETGGEHPSSGVFQTAEYEFAVTDGTATIGVVGGADGTAGEHKDYVAEGYWWYKADNFKLTLVELAPEAPTTYAITIAEGIENGSIEADVAEAAEGTKVTLTIEPADGYELDELSVKNGEDDVEVAEDYTFTMPAAAVTVSATFKEAAVAPTTYAITIAEGLTNGSVEATPAEAAAGETVTLTITPADGYELDELTVMAGETPVTVAEGYTFEMPASAVTVSATFKEKAVEPQPTLAAVKMTYVELNNTTAFGEVTEAKAGYNKIANNEVGFSNTGWNCNWITYIEVDASELKGAVAGAKLKAEISGATDSKRATGWGVGYNASAWSADMTYETADKSITTLGDVVWGTQKSVAVFEPVEFDITEAFKNGAKKATILVYETAAAGGIIKNVKVEMEMQETAPELANPSFELADADTKLTEELKKSGGAPDIYGWTMEGVGTSYNNTEILRSGSANSSAFGKSNVKDGEFAFFYRNGWNSNTNPTVVTLKTTVTDLPAGDYTLSVDYKAASSSNGDHPSGNTTVGISLSDTNGVIGSATSPAAQNNVANDYFESAEWQTVTAPFSVDAATAEATITITLTAAGGIRSDFFLDNVQFVKVPGVEFALKELEKSLEAAATVKAKYVLGDDLFQYAASEIEPLTNAITTAQAAYNAAKSKDAVNSAKETLDAFVATFAPAMNTPEAETAYILSLKTSNEASPFDLSFAAEGGVTIAETGTPTYFVAQEGGKYALYNGTEYVNYEGSNTWTMAASTEAYGWTIVAVEGGYTITGKNGFLGTNISDGNAAGSSCYGDKKTTNGNYIWTIAEYVEPTDPNDYTNMIVNADLTGEGGFDDTGTKRIDGSGVVKVGNAAPFDFKQTIANLPAGQYKLTAQAAYRYGGDEAAEAAAIAGGTETKLVQLYATVGETTVATPVQNRYDGASETDYANGEGSVVVNEKYVPNSTNAVKAWFAAGQYVNEVIFNIAEAGDVTIGINRTGTPESDYTVIGPWTLYRLGDAVVPNPTYEIAIKGGIENGTVEADATEAEAGATVKLTITPAEGYELKSISISYGEDEDAKTIEPDEENSFIMPAAPVVIDAVFSEIIPDIVLNAPTFNAEEGTQAEPNMLPEGSTLKINYTAENLEANGLTADDVKVKVTVMVSGDLPEAGMSMGSTTAHRVMGETFYIPLGETDFPVALKPGYVYQNVAVMAAELVKPATDTEEEETLAAYVGASAMCHWVGIYDDLLIEIAQDQGKSLDEFPRTEFVEGDDYNTYTCTEGIQVAFKMFDIDVKDCDYVIVKFAEPVAAGWELAFWAHNDQSTVAVPAGATEYKYVFADDTKCAIQNGILPQICMLRLWSGTPPLEAKVTGVYKHYLGNEVAQEINVERYPGMGYTATEATVDFALAKRVLGVKEVTNDMLRIVNPDNTEISDYAPYDGWFNAEGVAEAWNASTTKVCAKFFQAIPNGTFEICDMNGADEVGKTYSVKWALVANDKKVVYTINVTFVEKPAIALTFDDLNVVDEKAADFSFKLGTSYQSEKATVDVAAILDKLEVESLSDVTIYAVQSDGSLDDNYKLGTTDGWRNAAGDWQGWGADAFFYVKANFAATENQLYEVGTMDPTQNTTIEAGTFTAKYAFVKGNDTHDAVVLSVNVALVDPVGINSIEIAKAKGNGKYLDKKGHIIIVNDNKAFSLSGAEMK